MRLEGVVESVFPLGALVPKSETGVLNFLNKYPEYDGRDTTIAIFDSGVDPRSTGLQTLCDGKSVKVIERYDCTGCGDIDTRMKVTADSKGFITGISGRKLKLTPQMIANNTANGEYRIGLKALHDLCPSKVRENITTLIKTATWDEPHKKAIAEVSRKIVEFDSQNPDVAKLTWDKKLVKDNLGFTLEMLNNYEKIYNDIKISYDCILYQTGKNWQIVIDITEKGELDKAVHIGAYSQTFEIKNIDDYLSVSANVHDDGDVLELVGMCSPHGTHVASIASGNHSSKDVNGVAPNAKIISLTIGDGRLGSMETGAALVRAMIKVMEMCRDGRQIDVINMSYGEHAHWSNTGRIGELMNEVVNKYGVVWVASAGNHGPALCTVGTPPDISQLSCIGVGAFVSPQMMEAEYAMREKLPGNVYTWSSRDPCIDGGNGVTICAPGGAITSVPEFTMSKSQLMNGTSMAAPHVAGSIALLISGLKQRGMAYSPYSIKRAICATASKLDYVDQFAQGSGLLNVEKAFDYLVEYNSAQETMLRFSIKCGQKNTKGIHIREGLLNKPSEYGVNIEPFFFNEKEAAPSEKIKFNLRLHMVSSQPFVKCGSFLDLCYGARSMSVKVDPTGLPPGVHVASIRAYDSECIQKGSLFEIPVTVIQPHIINCEESRTFTSMSNRGDAIIEFQPNTIQRDFILVPKRATWAVLRMQSTDKTRDKDVGKFFVHTMQLLPKSSCRVMECMKILSVNTDNEAILGFRCQENNILELCIAKYWSNFGNTHLKYTLEFHGVQTINPNAYSMLAARGIHKLEVAALATAEIQPQIQLKTATVILKPTEAKISPLSSFRDVIPVGRQVYQNIITYVLNVTKAHEISFYAPIFNALLYEAEFESQLWMLFDSNKAMIAAGDAHSDKFYTKLEKGEYTIRLQIRHEKRELLEKVSETTMVAQFKLSNFINLDIYDHYNQSIISGRKFVTGVLKDNQTRILYVSPLSQEKFNKANLPCHCAWLSGLITLAKDEIAKKIDVQEFMYIFNPSENGKKNGNNSNSNSNSISNILNSSNNTVKPPKSGQPCTESGPTTIPSSAGDSLTVVSPLSTASTNGASPKKNKSGEEYAEGLRDFQCSMITKCELEKSQKIYEDVIAEHPKHLVAHLLLVQNIESTELKVQYPLTFVKSIKESSSDNDESQSKNNIQKIRTTLERIIHLVDIVIKETDKDALLAYYGLKHDLRSDATKIKGNMDKQKHNILEAFAKKGIAIAKLAVIDDAVQERIQDIDNVYLEIVKFSDPKDAKVLQFSIWHAYAHNQYGRMYKFLQKLLEDKRSHDIFDEISLIADGLDWSHVQTAVQRMAISAFPNEYRLF